MPVRTPGDVPDQSIVAFVDNEALPSIERPEADTLVGGARKKGLGIGRNDLRVAKGNGIVRGD